MSNKRLIIIRGISGAGKSTFANLIAEPKSICTADDFFVDGNGFYNFDVTKIHQAHSACQEKAGMAMLNKSIDNVVIANTNCSPKDFRWYENKANELGIPITYVVLEKRHENDNVHNCPIEAIERQHNFLINNLKLK